MTALISYLMKRGSLYSYPTYSSILYICRKYSCMYTEQRGNVLKNKRVLVLTCTTLYIHINRGSPERNTVLVQHITDATESYTDSIPRYLFVQSTLQDYRWLEGRFSLQLLLQNSLVRGNYDSILRSNIKL